MEKNEAEKIIAQYVKPIFGFALKRCKNVQDAEDLSQEIAWKAYRALLARDDIADCERFIRTVAHNALANYYRGKSGVSGVSFDEAENLPFPSSGEIETGLLAEESAAGYYIYAQSNKADYVSTLSYASFGELSALGIMLTLIVAPVTLGVKKLLEKIGPSVD